MRRPFAVLLLCSSLCLLGAGRAAVPPAPAATPAASPAPHPSAPAIVVYPFGTSGALKPDVGVKAQQLYVSQMTQDGGLDVISGGTDVKRQDYLKNARHLGADYYLTGYMTMLGSSVALVEQLVSTQSGTIVFAQTAQIESFSDAAAQAQAVHDAILQRENEFNAQIAQNVTTSATPTPLPGNEANLGGLFKRHARPTPAPTLAPSQKPAKGVFVVRIDGPLSAQQLAAGTDALYYALDGHYIVRLTSVPHANLAKEADAICGTQRDNTIATGTAQAQTIRHGLFHSTQYVFALTIYTCFGAQLAHATGTAGDLQGAIDAAVARYAAAHPHND